eukprot:44884_1
MSGKLRADKNAPKRCRTCHLSSRECDGLCWGFWKQTNPLTSNHESSSTQSLERMPIKIGDNVRPGADWNEIRFGKQSFFTIGTVTDIKSWTSGGEPDDCVVVSWNTVGPNKTEEKKANDSFINNIYRWGTIDKSGIRRYDLQV